MQRRGWMSQSEFLDAVGAVNLRFRVNSAWLIAAGALVGVLFF